MDWILSRPLALPRGNMLCVRDGRGLRLRPASGTVWVSQEGDAADVVLQPGDEFALRQDGLSIVHALRTSRLNVALPAGALPPRSIEIARSDGRLRRRIEFGQRFAGSIVAIGALLQATARSALRSVRRLRAALAASAAGPAPAVWVDGMPSRAQRIAAMRDPDSGRKAVLDEWMIWKQV